MYHYYILYTLTKHPHFTERGLLTQAAGVSFLTGTVHLVTIFFGNTRKDLRVLTKDTYMSFSAECFSNN
jgi:hypothetical protein